MFDPRLGFIVFDRFTDSLPNGENCPAPIGRVADYPQSEKCAAHFVQRRLSPIPSVADLRTYGPGIRLFFGKTRVSTGEELKNQWGHGYSRCTLSCGGRLLRSFLSAFGVLIRKRPDRSWNASLGLQHTEKGEGGIARDEGEKDELGLISLE